MSNLQKFPPTRSHGSQQNLYLDRYGCIFEHASFCCNALKSLAKVAVVSIPVSHVLSSSGVNIGVSISWATQRNSRRVRAKNSVEHVFGRGNIHPISLIFGPHKSYL